MSNAVLRFYRDDALQFDLNDGGQYALAEEYLPALPESPSLLVPVQESLPYLLMACSRDALLNLHIQVNRALEEALEYARRPENGHYWEIETQGSGGTYVARSMLLGGTSKLESDSIGFTRGSSRYIARAQLNLTRLPYWERPLAALTLVTSPSDNGANHFAVLPTPSGERPCALLLQVTGGAPTAGNIASCTRLVAALRANGTPANFVPQLQVGTAPATYSLTAGAKCAQETEAVNFLSAIGGNKTRLRYTPDAIDTWDVLATWTITTNVLDQYGRDLALVRYRDNSHATGSSTTNFYLRFRCGLRSGATTQWGPYWGINGDAGYKTLYAKANATTELFMLELGQGQVPAGGLGQRTAGTLVFELSAKAVSIAGGPTLDVDYVDLFPAGEAGGGGGLMIADFPIAIDTTNRAYLDSRVRQEAAYLTDGSDVLLMYANDYDYLGEITAWPNRSGQRLFLCVMQGSAGYYQHSFVTSLSLSAWAQARYQHMAGTV